MEIGSVVRRVARWTSRLTAVFARRLFASGRHGPRCHWLAARGFDGSYSGRDLNWSGAEVQRSLDVSVPGEGIQRARCPHRGEVCRPGRSCGGHLRAPDCAGFGRHLEPVGPRPPWKWLVKHGVCPANRIRMTPNELGVWSARWHGRPATPSCGHHPNTAKRPKHRYGAYPENTRGELGRCPCCPTRAQKPLVGSAHWTTLSGL